MRTTNDYMGKVILFLFIMYAVLMTFYLDYFTHLITTVPPLQGFLYFILLGHPEYLLVIYSAIALNRSMSKVRGFLAGLLLVVCIDIVSLPRIAYDVALTNGKIAFDSAALMANGDIIILNWIVSAGLSFKAAYFIYYLIIPILGMLIVLWLLGYQEFTRKVVQ